MKGRLVILAGPSCVGKSPLAKALARLRPDLAESLRPLVLYNSREPRPGERDGVDYHFRSRDVIEAMRDDEGRVVMDVRGDLQALDVSQLQDDLSSGDILFEGNPFVGGVLLQDPRLEGVSRLSLFMSPLSRGEVQQLTDAGADVQAIVTDVQRRKLLRRTRRQKGEPSLGDLNEVERRCGSAFREMRDAHHFDWVIPNHDGEDSENWDAFYYPLGDAGRAYAAFVDLLEGRLNPALENWPAEPA